MNPTYMPLRSTDENHEFEENFGERKVIQRTPAKLGPIALLLTLLITNIVTVVYFSFREHKQESVPRGYGEGQPRSGILSQSLMMYGSITRCHLSRYNMETILVEHRI